MKDLNLAMITSRNSRSMEYDWVILQQSVSNANAFSDLDIAADEEIQNVAHTRAKRQVIELVSMEVTMGVLKDEAIRRREAKAEKVATVELGQARKQAPLAAQDDVTYIIAHADFQASMERVWPRSGVSCEQDWIAQVIALFLNSKISFRVKPSPRLTVGQIQQETPAMTQAQRVTTATMMEAVEESGETMMTVMLTIAMV